MVMNSDVWDQTVHCMKYKELDTEQARVNNSMREGESGKEMVGLSSTGMPGG